MTATGDGVDDTHAGLVASVACERCAAKKRQAVLRRERYLLFATNIRNEYDIDLMCG